MNMMMFPMSVYFTTECTASFPSRAATESTNAFSCRVRKMST